MRERIDNRTERYRCSGCYYTHGGASTNYRYDELGENAIRLAHTLRPSYPPDDQSKMLYYAWEKYRSLCFRTVAERLVEPR